MIIFEVILQYKFNYDIHFNIMVFPIILEMHEVELSNINNSVLKYYIIC